jgi:hypothetical protein
MRRKSPCAFIIIHHHLWTFMDIPPRAQSTRRAGVVSDIHDVQEQAIASAAAEIGGIRSPKATASGRAESRTK